MTTDPKRHLDRFEDWSIAYCEAVARENNIVLAEGHRQVIAALQKLYKELGVTPRIRFLCEATGMSIKQLYDLFPSGLTLAAKLAGLPKPPCG
jgi:dissimilatory sulfite reductase related protein